MCPTMHLALVMQMRRPLCTPLACKAQTVASMYVPHHADRVVACDEPLLLHLPCNPQGCQARALATARLQ
jgi:hypothetical protein